MQDAATTSSVILIMQTSNSSSIKIWNNNSLNYSQTTQLKHCLLSWHQRQLSSFSTLQRPSLST